MLNKTDLQEIKEGGKSKEEKKLENF